MALDELCKLVIDTLESNKAHNIQVLDVRDLSGITDLMIIAEGASNRQIVSIADKLVEMVKQNKVPPLGMEGRQYGRWVLVDLGDIIVHIMHPAERAYYQLERLWSRTPPAVKVG